MVEQTEIGKGTAEGALAYLDRIIEKGRGTPGAINPLKIAFEKVVSEVDGAEWKKTLVSDINIDDYIARFGNLTRGKYTDKSLSVYKSRVNRVIGWYSKFMSQETPGYFPMVAMRSSASKSTRKTSGSTKATTGKSRDFSNITEAEVIDRVIQTGLTHSSAINPQRFSWSDDTDGLIEFPFPLGDGTIASLHLPRKLSISDAKRMTNYINSLVLDDSSEA